jgi:putative DNA primase/helicase
MIVRQTPLTPIFENIPNILTEQPNWVLWNYALKDGKYTKVPKQTNGSYASTTNPSTWSTFDAVRTAYRPDKFDGVGIVLTGKPLANGFYLIGMDFDHCIVDGVLDDAPLKAVDSLNTYWEISPSGEGIRLFLLHDKAIPARKTNIDGKSREIYSNGRYLTVTGHIQGEVNEVQYVA